LFDGSFSGVSPGCFARVARILRLGLERGAHVQHLLGRLRVECVTMVHGILGGLLLLGGILLFFQFLLHLLVIVIFDGFDYWSIFQRILTNLFKLFKFFFSLFC